MQVLSKLREYNTNMKNIGMKRVFALISKTYEIGSNRRLEEVYIIVNDVFEELNDENERLENFVRILLLPW